METNQRIRIETSFEERWDAPTGGHVLYQTSVYGNNTNYVFNTLYGFLTKVLQGKDKEITKMVTHALDEWFITSEQRVNNGKRAEPLYMFFDKNANPVISESDNVAIDISVYYISKDESRSEENFVAADIFYKDDKYTSYFDEYKKIYG